MPMAKLPRADLRRQPRPELQTLHIGQQPHPAITASSPVYSDESWQIIADPKSALVAAQQLLFNLQFFVELHFAAYDRNSPIKRQGVHRLRQIFNLLQAILDEDLRDVPLPAGPDQSITDFVAEGTAPR
jgi:hypothetical protein